MTITPLTRCFYHWHHASNDTIRRFAICFMASSSNSSGSSSRQRFRRSCANVPLVPVGFISKLCRILMEPIGKMSLRTVPQSPDRFSKDFWKSHSGRHITNTFPRFLILGFRSYNYFVEEGEKEGNSSTIQVYCVMTVILMPQTIVLVRILIQFLIEDYLRFFHLCCTRYIIIFWIQQRSSATQEIRRVFLNYPVQNKQISVLLSM